MDMKKKLEDAYIPDRPARKERVIIGLSGGVKSLVTAYLLKIQKYDLLAVTVVPGWESFPGKSEEVLSCQISPIQLEKIQEFCHQLNIPHFTIKASDEFQERVVESWMAKKVTGTLPRPCWDCHEFRMRLLHEKMKQLGAKKMATGHLGKLFQQEKNGTVYVHTSNDEINDQSELLNRLPPEILKSLLLPLSDLQKKEVTKLAENFGINPKDKKLLIHQCFPETPEITAYLEARIPPKFKPPGEITSLDKTDIFGEHQGVIFHTLGSPIMTSKLQRPNEMPFFSRYTNFDKKIMVGGPEFFEKKRVLLVDCYLSEGQSWIEPLKGSIKFGENDWLECSVFPKTLQTVLVEWESTKRVIEGEILTVYKKKGKNSKVYLTGKVKYLSESPQVEGEVSAKLNYARDF
jgi:tRNA U34 2-thiouridine synthase MnmA/TrmU